MDTMNIVSTERTVENTTRGVLTLCWRENGSMIRCRISLRETIRVFETTVYGRRRRCKPSSYARLNNLYKFHDAKDLRINEGGRRIVDSASDLSFVILRNCSTTRHCTTDVGGGDSTGRFLSSSSTVARFLVFAVLKIKLFVAI